jgi:hypothetical protein
MICHGAASRCMISDSANGNSCALQRGTLRAVLTDAICESEKTPTGWEAGCQAVHRLARPQHRADRQQILDHVRRPMRQRSMLVVAWYRRCD